MNVDFKSEYEESLQEYINARVKTDALLRTAQTANQENADYILTESANVKNLEDQARSRWESARNSYLQ